MRLEALIALTALAGVTATLEAQVPGTQPISCEEFVNRFPPQERAERIREAAKCGVIIRVPDFLDMVHDPIAQIAYLATLDEPLTAERLQTLTRALPAAAEGKVVTRIAAMLYRHGRDEGRTYLLQRLRQKDFTADLVLAMNRDETAVEARRGRGYVQRVQQLKTLKPLPRELLPESSRRIAGAAP